MPLKLAVLASGRGSNLDAILDAIENGLLDAEVGLLVSDKPDADCLEKAARRGVAATVALPPESGEGRDDYDRRLLEVLEAESPDLVVLAGFMRILTAPFCEALAGRIINIHPALLPAFKGAHGIHDTLAGGAKLAGCTTHYVTADLDGGPIILQAALAVEPGDDVPALAARVLRLEHQIFPRTIQLIAEGRVSVVEGTARIADGGSWRDRVPLVEGALYPAAF